MLRQLYGNLKIVHTQKLLLAINNAQFTENADRIVKNYYALFSQNLPQTDSQDGL
jgi:hypothetical protein